MFHSRRTVSYMLHPASCLVFAALCAATARADAHTPRIPIAVTGYTGSSTLTDFPVLVRLAEGAPTGFSYADCAADGSDIRFVDDEGTPLPHEIDTWNTRGTSCLWVKLPSLAQGTRFEMRYGGTPTAAPDATAVWTAFGGVWHMNENAATQTDRTGNGLDATMDDGVTYSLTNGPVGTAVSKSGILRTADFFAAGHDYTVPSASYTVSGWYQWPDYNFSANANPLQKGTWGQNGWYLQHKTANKPIPERMIIVWRDGTSAVFTVPNCAQNWNYLTATYDGSALKVYVNGATTPAATRDATFNQGTYPFIIGSVMGYADETRVMRSVASPDYVAADYAAQTGTLLTLDQAVGVIRPVLVPSATSIAYTTATLAAELAMIGEGATSATVSLAYGTDAANLPAPSVIATGLTAGQTATAPLTGLADGTTYHYAFTAVNNASPAESFTLTGTFTTKTFGAPEIAVRATPGLATSTIAVTVKTPGRGVPTCDVYVATGADPDSLDPEERIGDDVGIGAVVTKSVASPTTPYVTYFAVRVVNGEGKTTTASGSLDTEIKWYFDAKNSRLTNAAGWKVAASKTTVKGVEGYNIDGADAIKAAPKDGNGNYLTELDLTGLKNTGLDIVSLGGHIFRNNGGLNISLTKLHLPDTIIQTSGSSFITTGTILDFEPHEFPDLVSHATPGVPTALFANPVLSFPNPGYKTYPQQMWQANGAKAIYFGSGLTAFGNYAFDSSGATDLYLTGDAVPTTGTSWHRGTSDIRINVPIYSDEWKAYAAKSAADPTSAQRTTYATKFPDGRELWKVGSSGSYSGLYLAKWAPDDYCRNALHVRGNVSAGEVAPAYGKHK